MEVALLDSDLPLWDVGVVDDGLICWPTRLVPLVNCTGILGEFLTGFFLKMKEGRP